MAAILLADVTAACPAITAVPAPILTHVNGNGVAVDVFDGEDGTDTKLARCLLAAHMATMFGTADTDAGSAGPVTSETEGGISRSYGFAAWASSEMLAETKYGRAFAELARVNACGAWLA